MKLSAPKGKGGKRQARPGAKAAQDWDYDDSNSPMRIMGMMTIHQKTRNRSKIYVNRLRKTPMIVTMHGMDMMNLKGQNHLR